MTRKILIKPLLTLFIFIAPFAVWGQDTIKFEPLEFIDTINSLKDLTEIGEVEYCFRINEGNVDSSLFTISYADEVLLAKKIKNRFELYRFYTYGAYYTWYKVDNRFYIKRDAMGNSGWGEESDSCGNWRWSWDYESILILDILEMRMSMEEMYIRFNRSGGYIYDEFEGDDYKKKLKNCRNTYESFNAEFELENNMLTVSLECSGGDFVIDPETNESIITSSNNSHCFEEGYLQASEYHYINGNFVKVKPYINKRHFAHSVFDMGEKISLTPECTFYFECDCCFEHLLFTSDSTFIVVAPCTYDISVSFGKYEVKDNLLYLHFSGKWTERYMASDEQDTGTEYAYRDTIIAPHTEVYAPQVCKNKTLLVNDTNTQTQLLRSGKTTASMMEYLGRVGLLEKINK